MSSKPDYLAAIAELARHPLAIEPLALNSLIAALEAMAGGSEASIGPVARQDPRRAAPGGVGVLPVMGPLTYRRSLFTMIFGGTPVTELRAELAQMAADPAVERIVLYFDTPGGSVAGIPELAAEIRAARARKPVAAFIDVMAASAGYWLASQADEIVVTPSGDVGSIGVFTLHFDHSKMMQAAGVKPTFIFAGRHKVDGNPYEPLSDEAKADLQADVDRIYAAFLADAAVGRKVQTSRVRTEFGQGRLVPARDAVRLGMADRIGTFAEALRGITTRKASTASRGALSAMDARRRRLAMLEVS